MYRHIDVLKLAGLDRFVITLDDIFVLGTLPSRVYAWRGPARLKIPRRHRPTIRWGSQLRQRRS